MSFGWSKNFPLFVIAQSHNRQNSTRIACKQKIFICAKEKNPSRFLRKINRRENFRRSRVVFNRVSGKFTDDCVSGEKGRRKMPL